MIRGCSVGRGLEVGSGTSRCWPAGSTRTRFVLGWQHPGKRWAQEGQNLFVKNISVPINMPFPQRARRLLICSAAAELPAARRRLRGCWSCRAQRHQAHLGLLGACLLLYFHKGRVPAKRMLFLGNQAPGGDVSSGSVRVHSSSEGEKLHPGVSAARNTPSHTRLHSFGFLPGFTSSRQNKAQSAGEVSGLASQTLQ